MKICEKCKLEEKYYYCPSSCCEECEYDCCCPPSCFLEKEYEE